FSDRQDLKGVEAGTGSNAGLFWVGKDIDRNVEHFGNSFEHRKAKQRSLAALDLVHPTLRPAAEVSELLAVNPRRCRLRPTWWPTSRRRAAASSAIRRPALPQDALTPLSLMPYCLTTSTRLTTSTQPRLGLARSYTGCPYPCMHTA